MKIVADLHIHSHYSRATSKNLTFEHLARWAQLKGIQVVATGDVTHPGWLEEMRSRLVPAEDGLYRLADEYTNAVQAEVPPACRAPVRFLLGGEISNIYKRDDRTRKVHNLVFLPGLDDVARLQARLETIGNIRSDGRPILGLDSRDLLALVLETGPGCCLIPAHIWTPWFSLLGSRSGFDSVAACFGDLTPEIFALETGLSSDPPMNWRVSSLDGYTLVSNSDAHSPEKLGRETTLFEGELSYAALFAALRRGDPATFAGTVEFFPEEGKYHFDGHRACGIAWDPVTTLAHGGICPVCGKEVTVGVMHRVETLADRPAGARPPRPQPFASLVPLPELLGQVYSVGAGSRQVEAEYFKLLGRLGPELAILRDLPLEEIAAVGGPRLAEGIGRMRRGEVQADAGYDGEYGVIHVFAAAGGGGAPGAPPAGQLGLLAGEEAPGSAAVPGSAGLRSVPATGAVRQPGAPAAPSTWSTASTSSTASTPGSAAPPGPVLQAMAVPTTAVPAGLAERPRRFQEEQASLFDLSTVSIAPSTTADALLAGLNPAQREAVLCTDEPLVIIAGPGTGKTHTLTVRLAYLVQVLGVAPEALLAITFTNKAAEEMAGRLAALLGPAAAARVTIKTFHAFGSQLLRAWAGRAGLSPDFSLCAEADRLALLRQVRPDLRPAEAGALLARISSAKNRLLAPDAPELVEDEAAAPGFCAAYAAYEAGLAAAAALDFDDLIARPVRLLEAAPDVLAAVGARYRWLSVDEYQDVNFSQYRLLRLLAGDGATPQRGANLCVIGDPDQAIYGFRGADRRYFLAFQADYPAARVLRLSENYRSTQVILDAAGQMIGGEEGADGDEDRALIAAGALADFAGQVKLDIHRAPTDRAEAEYVVHQIERLIGGTSYFSLDSGRVAGAAEPHAASFADFAVLYRLGSQSRLLCEAFDRSGIPYQTIGQAPLTAQADVQQVLAHLWLLHNPASRLHLETALAGGKPALPAAIAARVSAGLAGAASPAGAAEAVAAGGGLTAAQAERLAGLAAFWCSLAAARGEGSVARLVELAGQFCDPAAGDAVAARRRLLAGRAAAYGDRLGDFLEAVVLQSETDVYDPRADRVTLMTLHAAKGLEFPVVFVVGCEEGLLPYLRPGATENVAEERRLFYVGMTRARQKLILTSAATRFLYGRRVDNPPSRFVNDIEAALLEVQAGHRRPRKAEGKQLSLL